MGAQNIANGSAALEPDFSANTINTTWYSNGTQLTGNNIPATCTYDDTLVPPTPADRPGYVFAGWKARNCSLAGLDPTIRGTNDSGVNLAIYDIGFDPNATWAVTFPYGEIRGIDIFTQTSNGTSIGQVGTPGNDVIGYGDGYCWCRISEYIPNGGTNCSFTETSWVLVSHVQSASGSSCPSSCASIVSDYNGCDQGHPSYGMYTLMGLCNTEPDHSVGISVRRALFGQTQ